MGRIIALFIAAITLAALPGCGDRQANTSDKNGVVHISVWHPWGGTQKEMFELVVKKFEEAHPKIKVHVVFTSNNLSNNQKFFTSVSAHKPPDVTFVDGPQVSEWAEQGALQPLDKLIENSGIKPEDFFNPCWNQNSYDGHSWAMTYCADPNFAFVWNKKCFREAGLDPEIPPRTIEELDQFNKKLTKIENGNIVRMGIIPWAQFGGANSVFTWGWAFGGSFYDDKTRKITTDDPRVIKALEWMTSYAKQYDVNKIASFQQGFGSAEQNPLYIGKVAMSCLHIFQIEDIKTYAPDLDYGISYIPSPVDGEQHSSWVGGWCLAIPRGSRHPKEAWEFIRWMCAEPEGTTIVAKKQGLFPGWRHSPYFKEIEKKKGYSRFLEIMQECRHQRPVMPAQAFYMGALDRAVDYAIHDIKSPKQALEDARKETQEELDLRLAGQ